MTQEIATIPVQEQALAKVAYDEAIDAEKLLKAEQAPDKEKLLVIARDIESIRFPQMKSSVGIKIAGDAAELLIKVTDYIKQQAGNL